MRVLGACRFGFAGGCVKKLKTMGESGVKRVGEGLGGRGFWVCGGAVGADL